jgi:hypothetical protein
VDHGQTTKEVKCFPNPSTNRLFFDIPIEDNIDITVTSLFGENIITIQNYQNLSGIDISTLNKGVYFYRIKTKTKNYSGKFIKE